jgi:AraC family transcriptional regulator
VSAGPCRDWYRDDPAYAGVPCEFRGVGAHGSTLIKLKQPAGRYVRPAGDAYMLQLVVDGRSHARLDHGSIFECHGEPSWLALSPANTNLSYDVSGELSFLTLILPTVVVSHATADQRSGRSSDDFGSLHTTIFQDELVQALLLRMWAEAESGSPGGMLFMDSALDTVVRSLMLQVGPIATRKSCGGLAPWQIRRATEFMEDRLGEDVSLDDLSRLLDLTNFHLCRAFKQSVGEPPHRWRQGRRMERARQMLEGTDLPVIEIAAAVGHADPSRFAMAFRKTFGLNPSAYRRARRR